MKRKIPSLDKRHTRHRELLPEEKELWHDTIEKTALSRKELSNKKKLPKTIAAPKVKIPKSTGFSEPHKIDDASLRKIRKGDTVIDATLDLHGHTQEKAHTALINFIVKSHGNNHRMLLVITGKGKGGKEGVLRRLLPLWLAESPLREYIIAYDGASARHGGAGAWYIRIRKRTDKR